MNTIYLQTRSWITDTLGIPGHSTYIIERKIEAGTTLLNVLSDLAKGYAEFKRMIFNPETGKINDQILIIINQNLVKFNQVKDTPLKDKDVIDLAPVYFGG